MRGRDTCLSSPNHLAYLASASQRHHQQSLSFQRLHLLPPSLNNRLINPPILQSTKMPTASTNLESTLEAAKTMGRGREHPKTDLSLMQRKQHTVPPILRNSSSRNASASTITQQSTDKPTYTPINQNTYNFFKPGSGPGSNRNHGKRKRTSKDRSLLNAKRATYCATHCEKELLKETYFSTGSLE